MRGTEEVLRVLGKSGTIEKAEDLPEDYDLERSFRFSTLVEMAENCDSEETVLGKVIEKQEELQRTFEEKKKRIENQLDEVGQGDKVRVDPAHSNSEEGVVRSFSVDRGHVFYKVYSDHDLLGEFKDEYVEKVGEVSEE